MLFRSYIVLQGRIFENLATLFFRLTAPPLKLRRHAEGEKRRYNQSYGEAFQRSELEKEQVKIHNFRLGGL